MTKADLTQVLAHASWLDAATAALVLVSLALLLLDEVESHTWSTTRRVLTILWVPLAVAFVAKVVMVLAPIVAGMNG
jgi:hypothetical protein